MSEFKFPDEADNTQPVEWEEVPDTESEVEASQVSDEDDAEIEIIDSTPERDRGRKPLDREVADPTDDELKAYSDGVQKRIKELTHARHDERRKAEALAREKAELERIARAMIEENNRLKQYVQTGEQEYAKAATTSAELELEAARKRYKEAYESGDADQLVAANDALTDAKLKLAAVKNFKPTPLQETREVVQTPQVEPESQIDQKTLRWKAKNQWFGTPGYEETTAFALGLHQKLVNSGVDPRSDEYFEQIDARVRAKFPEMFGEYEQKPSAAPKKPATVVAPVARSTSAKKIKLTSDQMAVIKRLGITPQQYVAEMAKLEKQNG